jgi:hypothetical protein
MCTVRTARPASDSSESGVDLRRQSHFRRVLLFSHNNDLADRLQTTRLSVLITSTTSTIFNTRRSSSRSLPNRARWQNSPVPSTGALLAIDLE